MIAGCRVGAWRGNQAPTRKQNPPQSRTRARREPTEGYDMKLADMTQDERISLGVAAARGIKDNLPVDGFGQTKRLNDYADIWGAAARNAMLARLAEIVAEHKASSGGTA